MAIRRWGTESLVNTTTSSNQSAPVTAAQQEGGYVTAWVDDMGDAASVIKFQRFDVFGRKVGVETTLVRPDGEGEQDQISIATLSDGGFVIANRDGDPSALSDIAVSRFSAAGLQTFQTQIDFDKALLKPSVIADGNGYRLVYQYTFNSTDNDLYADVFDNNNVKSSTQSVNGSSLNHEEPDVDYLALVTLGGNYFYVYSQNPMSVGGGSIYLTRTTASGTQVGTTTLIAQGDQFLGHFGPTITTINESLAVITWMNFFPLGNQADAQNSFNFVFISGGGAIVNGPNGFPIQGGVSGALYPQVTALDDDSFAVVYRDFDGIDFNICIRQFDTSGVGGPEFIVNTNGTGANTLPQVSKLADGRLIVTWTEQSGLDGSRGGVFQQIIDPRDGTVVGSNDALLAEILTGNDNIGDQISGRRGNDTIYGLAGADVIYGGDGDDNLYGGRGDDTSYGGANNDRIYGDLGDDEQYGDTGNDLLYSGRGADLMDGGAGSDTAYYSTEIVGAVINLLNQSLNAGSADGDTLVGIETIFGSLIAADNISGDNLNNTLLGNGGADTLNGNGGGDVLRGGAGADILNGGTGADKFQYTALADMGDTITNYEAIDDFQFLRSAFGNLAGTSVAAVNFLSVASGNAATTTSHRFIFDQATDRLWYDADGSTATIAAVMVADLSNNINITAADLLLL